MIKYLFFLTLLSTHFHPLAQSTEDSIQTTINNLFNAMHESDSVLLMDCFHEGAILQTLVTTSKGETKIRTENVAEFASFVQGQTKKALHEKIKFDAIYVDGALATVWTPYTFYYRNSFSHCGVNSFQLVRVNDTWKIQYLIDTRRKLGCDAVLDDSSTN